MWASCREGLRQFRDSVTSVTGIGRITVRRQLLKGQQNLVCFKCRRGVLTAKLWLTCGARLLLFCWGNSRGAVRNLFLNCCHYVKATAHLFWTSCHHAGAIANLSLNSCHHVTTIFWAKVLCSLDAEDACFRMRITLGVVLIRSLVFHVCVPECVVICGFKRTSSNLERAPKMRDSVRPADLLGQFFIDSAFYLLRTLCDIFLVNSRNGRISLLAVRRMFLLCFSCNGCQLWFLSQRCRFWRENNTQLWRLN